MGDCLTFCGGAVIASGQVDPVAVEHGHPPVVLSWSWFLPQTAHLSVRSQELHDCLLQSNSLGRGGSARRGQLGSPFRSARLEQYCPPEPCGCTPVRIRLPFRRRLLALPAQAGPPVLPRRWVPRPAGAQRGQAAGRAGRRAGEPALLASPARPAWPQDPGWSRRRRIHRPPALRTRSSQAR